VRAQAHRLGRQNQHIQIVRQVRQSRFDNAIHQHRIHTQWQMRAMLLGGRHRQQGDGARGLAAGLHLRKFQRAQVSPVA